MPNSRIDESAEMLRVLLDNETRKDPQHKAFIESLPCAICGAPPKSFLCHCRMSVCGDVVVPKNERGGTGLKPYDKWGWPGCDRCHSRQGESNRRNNGERHFWEQVSINPLELAQALYRNTGNRSACLGIIQRRRNGGEIL